MLPRPSKWKHKSNILRKQFNLVKFLKLWNSSIVKIYAAVHPIFSSFLVVLIDWYFPSSFPHVDHKLRKACYFEWILLLLVFGILLQIPPFSFQNPSIKLGKRTYLLGWGWGEGNVLLFARLTALIKKKKRLPHPQNLTQLVCVYPWPAQLGWFFYSELLFHPLLSRGMSWQW